MRITALTPQRHHRERVNVYLDGEFRCGLAAEIAYGGGLRVGNEIDVAALAALERKDLLWQAREAAFNLLSYRARTEAGLRRRLRRKEFPDEVVAECVAELVARGLVDDDAFSASFVRDRVRSRPRGVRRLVQELRTEGVDAASAEAVVARTLDEEDVSELDLARDAATAWARRALGPTTAKRDGEPTGPRARGARRRLYGYLARRGFAADVIRTVMEETIDPKRD